MSTLEKAIILLHEMPEQTLETVYAFMQTISAQPPRVIEAQERTAFGIAHKYANTSLMEQETEAFRNAMVQKHALN